MGLWFLDLTIGANILLNSMMDGEGCIWSMWINEKTTSSILEFWENENGWREWENNLEDVGFEIERKLQVNSTTNDILKHQVTTAISAFNCRRFVCNVVDKWYRKRFVFYSVSLFTKQTQRLGLAAGISDNGGLNPRPAQKPNVPQENVCKRMGWVNLRVDWWIKLVLYTSKRGVQIQTLSSAILTIKILSQNKYNL